MGSIIAPTKFDVTKFIPEHLLKAESYDFTDSLTGVRLHLNESPLPPPKEILEKVSARLSEVNKYNYPGLFERFRELAAEYSGVEPGNVLPTAGGDGAIKAVLYNLANPGDRVVLNYPSYSMFWIYSKVRGFQVDVVRLKEDTEWWKEDTEDLLKKAEGARLVVIDDPNNPTGSPMLGAKREVIEEIASRVKGFVLIDEAYHEYAGYSVAKLVEEIPNLLVVRTMSKAFSMAALRVGYLIGSKQVISSLAKGSTPFDVSLPGLIAGITALENPAYVRERVEEVRRNREFTVNSLRRLGLKAYNSVTNFVLFRHKGDLINPLMERGYIIRKLWEDFYRVSIGTEDQMKGFVEALGEILEGRSPK